MQITKEQYHRIKHILPVQRGNVRIDNFTFLRAIFYIAENGCQWRKLSPEFGNWHTIYRRMFRRAENGIWQRVNEAFSAEHLCTIEVTVLPLDSASAKVHPNGASASKKKGQQSIGKSKGGWNCKIHLVVANERTAMKFHLSGGDKHDSPEGRKMVTSLSDEFCQGKYLAMDRAYEGDENRQQAKGMEPVVPPKKNRKEPWEYDKELYKRRNEVERFNRRIKEFRRVFTPYDKLDMMYAAFVQFPIISNSSIW